jgi:hypothetical protein
MLLRRRDPGRQAETGGRRRLCRRHCAQHLQLGTATRPVSCMSYELNDGHPLGSQPFKLQWCAGGGAGGFVWTEAGEANPDRDPSAGCGSRRGGVWGSCELRRWWLGGGGWGAWQRQLNKLGGAKPLASGQYGGKPRPGFEQLLDQLAEERRRARGQVVPHPPAAPAAYVVPGGSGGSAAARLRDAGCTD